MANNVQGKNVQGVIFLRNGSPYANHDAALSVLRANTMLNRLNDGEMALARYISDQEVKTLVGVMYKPAQGTPNITIIDVEGASADVEALITEINNKLGSGITAANTATAQLEALSGATFTAGTSSSADTSVEGAKAYAYDLLGTLDYTDTAETGSYVSKVDQVDGKISTTKVELPSVTGQPESKKVVIAVSENKGTVSDTKGTISSSAGTIVLNDNTDGGIDFDVNIDGTSIVKGANGVLGVADSALTQYFGDEKTVHAEVDSVNNKKTFSTLLKIAKNTNPSEANVKEEYNLVDVDGTPITGADTIKIYKDSALLSVALLHADTVAEPQLLPTYNKATDTWTDIPATAQTEANQALCYAYEDVSGNTVVAAVPVGAFINEAEFASGITWDATEGKARGVVDPTSESFLTVGANGFKISGVSGLVENAIEALDANVSGNSTHVTVGVVEEDGVITAVTVSESDIANATDLAALSAKTITNIKSTNTSIDIATANTADGTVEVDVTTDADKIKMSGFTTTSASSFSGIAESDSIATAFEKADAVITENERVTAAALNDLNDKIDNVSGASLSGVSVNGIEVPRTDNVSEIGISGATSAATPTSTEAIVVNVNQSTGAITLGLGYIDCGTYDDQPEQNEPTPEP